ncbi:MAG TPA: class I adenylate-forming enzyme family protein [Burkholderiales bacterium]|nr:class I adenylate-forming enzyme family protein [Burkholderiales bacterium]
MKEWLPRVPPLRAERHFGRIVDCYVERPGSLVQMLEEAASRNPRGEALVDGERRLDWWELRRRVAAAGSIYVQHGIAPGDRVGILLGNRAEFPLAFLAAAWIGAIPVPISIREQKPGLEYILGHCAAKGLVYEPELEDRLPQFVPAKLTPDALWQGSSEEKPNPVGEDDTAAILYTSGTTGRPKGAMLSNLGIVHSSMNFQHCMRLDESSRLLAAVPLSHVTGVIALLAASLRCAGTLIILPAFKARDFLALASRERMTYTLIVPAMYNLCLLEKDFDNFDLSAWRIGAYGGAPMPAATIAALAGKLPRLGLMNAYGATETTSPTTLMPAEDTAAKRDSVGLPVPGAQVKVVDDELWIRGPMVVKGYWQDPAATDREFTDGYWHSGDVGAIDAHGYVQVLDRKKDMINRGGYKVYSAEVEGVLAEHPAVVEAAVVGYPCPVLGERVKAVVSAREMVAAEVLRAFCAARLADYKVPETIAVRMEPLPRNANGKILKRELRNLPA